MLKKSFWLKYFGYIVASFLIICLILEINYILGQDSHILNNHLVSFVIIHSILLLGSLLLVYLQYELQREIEKIKHIEHEFKAKENLFDFVPVGIVKVTVLGSVIEANEHAQKFLGLKFDEKSHLFVNSWAGKTVDEDENEFPVSKYPVTLCLQTSKPQGPETLGVVTPTTTIHWGIFTAVPVFNDDAVLDAVIVSIVDISDRKIAEEEHSKSEDRYRKIVEHSPEAIVVHTNGVITFVNNAAVTLLEAQNENVLLGKNALDLVHPDSKELVIKRMKIAMQDRQQLDMAEERFVTLKGNTIDVEVIGSPVVFKNEPSVQIMARDITSRIKSEKVLRKSLKEKEVLIQEIHHRVKNNLQVISSLLNLQARSIDDNSVKEMFLESQNRVKTMAILHDKLYQKGSLSEINISEYLRSIVENVCHSTKKNHQNIEIEYNFDDVLLSVQVTISCGLILNEVFTNCLKHAFPATENIQDKRITISLHCQEQECTLVISDNGIGFSYEIDPEVASSSLGIQLVEAMSSQINARANFENNNGTTFKLVFVDTNL